MTMKNDEGPLEKHTRGHSMGRIRPARLDEGGREDLFRPEAVLALVGRVPSDLSAFEMHIAQLIDGTRPVARLRKKSGVSSADLRIALGGLADRHLIRLAGIVEEAAGPLAAEIAAMAPVVAVDEPTIPGGTDLIPPHVMAEIQSMLDDEDAAEELKGLDGLDEDTEVLSRKK